LYDLLEPPVECCPSPEDNRLDSDITADLSEDGMVPLAKVDERLAGKD